MKNNKGFIPIWVGALVIITLIGSSYFILKNSGSLNNIQKSINSKKMTAFFDELMPANDQTDLATNQTPELPPVDSNGNPSSNTDGTIPNPTSDTLAPGDKTTNPTDINNQLLPSGDPLKDSTSDTGTTNPNSDISPSSDITDDTNNTTDTNKSMPAPVCNSQTVTQNDSTYNLALNNPIQFYEQAQNDSTNQKVDKSGTLVTGFGEEVTSSGIIGKDLSMFLANGENMFKKFIPRNNFSDVNKGEKQVQLSGYKINDFYVGDATSQDSVSNIQAPLPRVEQSRVPSLALVLVNYQDSPSESITKEEVRDMVFNGQFNKYYKEQSFNKLSFTGDVYGWYTLPVNTPAVCDPINFTFNSAGNSAHNKTLIFNKYPQLANYDLVYILVHCSCGPNMSGIADLRLGNNEYKMGGTIMFNNSDNMKSTMVFGANAATATPFPFKWTWFDRILTHEIGHNLGELYNLSGSENFILSIDHSTSTNCKGLLPPLAYLCPMSEYGNPFDDMGSGGLALHFNGYIKNILGWISDNDVLNIDKSGTYSLKPIESEGAQVAKVNISDIQYSIEYRAPIGFDITAPKGLYVLLTNSFNSLQNSLIDLFPNPIDREPKPQNVTNSYISGTQRYVDVLNDITIGPIISASWWSSLWSSVTSPVSFPVVIGNNYKCNQGVSRKMLIQTPNPTWRMTGFVYEVDDSKNSYRCNPSELNSEILTLSAPEDLINVFQFGANNSNPSGFMKDSSHTKNSITWNINLKPARSWKAMIELIFADMSKNSTPLQSGAYPVTITSTDPVTNKVIFSSTQCYRYKTSATCPAEMDKNPGI